MFRDAITPKLYCSVKRSFSVESAKLSILVPIGQTFILRSISHALPSYHSSSALDSLANLKCRVGKIVEFGTNYAYLHFEVNFACSAKRTLLKCTVELSLALVSSRQNR